MLTSGVRNSLSPLTGDAKRTPSSLILRIAPSDQTWKPPLSVSIGRVQPSKRCRPPKRASTSSPGRSQRWKVLPRMICAPISSSDARQHALDGAVGADRHEDRRLDDAVVQRQAAAARAAVGGQQFEGSIGGLSRVCARQQHRVAVAEEAVALARSRARRARGMRSWPANALTSISSVLFGRWKFVTQQVDDAEREARRDEDVGLACAGASARRAAAQAADSSARSVVVPTATIAPAARARARRSPRRRRRRPRTTRCASRARRGSRCAPAGRCRRRRAASRWRAATPRAASAASSAASKCSAAVGAATAPGRAANTVW